MKTLIEMAKEAGFAIDVSNDPNSPPSWWGAGHDDRFKAFEALVRADEREQIIAAQPAQKPEYCGPSSSVFGLAEMILSDCGFSSDYQPLLNRVAARITGYIDTPPAAQRQWVGLTDEERTEIRREHYARTLPLMDAVEAKLKEKNNSLAVKADNGCQP